MDEGGAFCVMALFIMVSSFAFGYGAGISDANIRWKNRTVDTPEYIIAVKEEVLAERKVLKLKENN